VRGFLCPLVFGRDGDLEELRGALEGAARSSLGSVVFVVGEAGIGKSRLAREAIAEARRERFSVLSGRATQADGTVAFRPVAEALFSYFRDEGPPDLPELEPFRPVLARLVPEWRRHDSQKVDDSIVVLAEAVLRLLRAVGRRRGCLLVLDDLHWADPETLSIVEYLAANIASEPFVCLCTVRSEEESSALGLVHTLLARRAASVIELARLDPADTAAMACACLSIPELPGPVDALLSAHADGLPFFVEELLAGAVGSGALTRGAAGWTADRPLQPDVPRTFVDSVDRRLAALGEATPVLVAAAVLGRWFDWTLLPEITGLPEQVVLASLRDGVDAQLLIAEPSPTGSFRFRHALTREAVTRRLLPVERAVLAHRALDAIESSHPGLPGEWCDLGARLAERAGDRRRAAILLLESGKRSLSGGALATAENALGRARELADDPVVVADVADALCESLSLAGKTDRALEVGLELDAALQSLAAPPQRLGRLHLRLARAAASACHWAVADGHLQQARARAGEANDQALTARADVIAAQIAFGRDDLKGAREQAESALAVAERLGLHDLTCEALEVIGRSARLSDIDQAEHTFERARAVAEQYELTVWRIRALFELGTIDLICAGPNDRLASARDLALATGALATAAQVDMHLAGWFLDHFEPEQAIDAARRSSEIARRFGMQQLLAEAAGHGRVGRRDEMEARIGEALAVAGETPEVGGCAWGHCRAMLSLIGENRVRALRELDSAMDFLRRLSTSPPYPERGLWALLRVVADRDGESACAEVRASGATVQRMNRGYLHLADAVLLGRAGRRKEAEHAFAAGDAELVSVSWFRHYARRLVTEAAIADGWGDPAGWMREALACFEEHGQDRLMAASRSLLHKAGAPVPRRRQDSHIPLVLRELGVTQREMDVLTLLADGLGNKEIAARLYLSPRTVERHIANLTVKSGLRTRSELVAFAARNDAAPSRP
jgi:DNA-binding CsgD family transcriptional regulator/tetratricopeptide (TPR) repeat protein